jgi:hypothetical protein
MKFYSTQPTPETAIDAATLTHEFEGSTKTMADYGGDARALPAKEGLLTPPFLTGNRAQIDPPEIPEPAAQSTLGRISRRAAQS